MFTKMDSECPIVCKLYDLVLVKFLIYKPGHRSGIPYGNDILADDGVSSITCGNDIDHILYFISDKLISSVIFGTI